MSQHKKQPIKDRRASRRKKTPTTCTIELLESRFLLSADLAGAVQAAPVSPLVPQQAVVLNVEAVPSVGQQTL